MLENKTKATNASMDVGPALTITAARSRIMGTYMRSSVIVSAVAVVLLGSACQPPRSRTELAIGRLATAFLAEGQAWADAMRFLAHSDADGDATALAHALRDSSSAIRERAAMALALLGPAARTAVPALINATRDPEPAVRAEAVFALGMVGERSERVFHALANASGSRLVTRRVSAAVSRFAVHPRLTISSPFDEDLRAHAADPDPWTRLRILDIASRTKAAWVSGEYLRLLREPDPELRSSAAWSLAALGDTAPAVRSALAQLSSDSVDWIRRDVPDMLRRLDNPRPDLSTCPHRAHEGPIPATAVIESGSISLRGDGRGPYVQGRDGVSASHSYAFNLRLNPVSGTQPGIGPRSPATGDSASRAMFIDLGRPVRASGAAPLGIIRDAGASLHFFYLRDRNGAIWNTRDIPVGAKAVSDRTELTFEVDGRWHRLHFGPWAIGDCQEAYASGAAIHGAGTSSVQIERLSASAFRVFAPTQSRARLWDYANPAQPRDRGLYEFAFEVSVTALPTAAR